MQTFEPYGTICPRTSVLCYFRTTALSHYSFKVYFLQESSVISSLELKETDTTPLETPTTEAVTPDVVEEVRECSPVTLSLCSHLPYNSTSYPNLVGHTTKDALMRDLVAFRELLDAECSHLAQVKFDKFEGGKYLELCYRYKCNVYLTDCVYFS